MTAAEVTAHAAAVLAEVAREGPGTPQPLAALQASLTASLSLDTQSLGVSLDNGTYTVTLTHTNGQSFQLSATATIPL